MLSFTYLGNLKPINIMKGFSVWHSSITKEVYHNNKSCKEGDNIQPENVREGKGTNRHLCNKCKELNLQQRKKR